MNKKLLIVVTIVTLIALMTVTTVIASPLTPKKTPQPQGTEGSKPGNDNAGNAGALNWNAHAKDKNLHAVNYYGIVMDFSTTSLTLLLRDDTTLAFVITPDTTVKVPTFSRTSTIADLQYGMRVVVHAWLDKTTGTLTVRSINVVPGNPIKYNRVGTVTDYQPGISITIADANGATQTYLLTPTTPIILTDPSLVLGVGSQVTIIVNTTAAGETPTASGVIVTMPVVTPTAEPSPEPGVEPTEEP